MAAKDNQSSDSWGATVDAPAGPAAKSPALLTTVQVGSCGSRKTVAEEIAEAAEAAAAACHVDILLVTSKMVGDVPQTEAATPMRVTSDGIKSDGTA